jgi:hypothetical protein
MEKGRLLEPKPPSGQIAHLRAGIAKKLTGVTLVSARHSPRQFPLHPYSGLQNGSTGSCFRRGVRSPGRHMFVPPGWSGKTQSTVVRGYRALRGARGTDPAWRGVRPWRDLRMQTPHYSAALAVLILVATG